MSNEFWGQLSFQIIYSKFRKDSSEIPYSFFHLLVLGFIRQHFYLLRTFWLFTFECKKGIEIFSKRSLIFPCFLSINEWVFCKSLLNTWCICGLLQFDVWHAWFECTCALVWVSEWVSVHVRVRVRVRVCVNYIWLYLSVESSFTHHIACVHSWVHGE